MLWKDVTVSDIDLDGFDDIVPLGSGGLGDVYRATRRSTGGDVAIKVLRDWSDHDVAMQRAEPERSSICAATPTSSTSKRSSNPTASCRS